MLVPDKFKNETNLTLDLACFIYVYDSRVWFESKSKEKKTVRTQLYKFRPEFCTRAGETDQKLFFIVHSLFALYRAVYLRLSIEQVTKYNNRTKSSS